MPGKLLLIGTPLGNLQDLSPRALDALRSCSLLLCEDTRHTRKLLSHFSVSVKVESFHEHNEQSKADGVLDRVAFGETVGLVSDAGMPVLSDPGYLLVRRARERRITVEPIPGPFAAALALVASGIAPIPFAFWGFAPHRHGERLTFYRRLAESTMTGIVYESPQRLVASLTDARSVLGNVEVTVAREMTKLHEELMHLSLDAAITELSTREIKGEITIVFAAPEARQTHLVPGVILAEFRELVQGGLSRGEALKLLAERHGRRKNELYDLVLQEEEKPGS
ncbi:MAG: 16S rRNA (cytidine(1402)-2'-O)-methyltransferase [Acidobacteriota bacterium]